MSSSRTQSAIDETAPLLQHTSHDSHTDSTNPKQRFSCSVPLHVPLALPTLIPLLGTLTVFFNEAEFYLKGPAQLRAIEALACFEYFSARGSPLAKYGRNIPELECKIPAVQERVALLNGAQLAIRMVCAVVGTFWLLHRFKAGRRRPVLVLHKANLIVSNALLFIAYFGYPTVPIWFITLTGATSIFGGNFEISSTTLFAAYADVIPDAARRSSLIFITTSLQYAAQAICLPVTGKLMSLDGNGGTPEVSFYIASACSLIVFLMTFLLFPETFKPESDSEESEAAGNTDGATSPKLRAQIDGRENQHSQQPQDSAVKSSTSKPLSNAPHHVLRREFGLLRVIFLLIATFCAVTSTRIIDWYGILQYPGIKFHWTVSRTTWLISMQAVLTFINLFFILPAINRLLQHRYGFSAKSTSVGIVIGSSLILTLSAVVLGLPGTTPTIFILATVFYTFGTGMASAIQTYTISAASTPRSSGAALTVISIAGTVGKVAASAIWPSTLSIGLEHPSGKLGGLPFFVDAVLFVTVGIAMFFAGWTGKNRKESSD